MQNAMFEPLKWLFGHKELPKPVWTFCNIKCDILGNITLCAFYCWCSYFLWNIALQTKVASQGMTFLEDKQAKVNSAGIMTNQLLYERVSAKVFAQYAKRLENSDNVHANFKTKLCRNF